MRDRPYKKLGPPYKLYPSACGWFWIAWAALMALVIWALFFR